MFVEEAFHYGCDFGKPVLLAADREHLNTINTLDLVAMCLSAHSQPLSG